jgi:two-component system invasion response regulator UvrY
VTKNASADQISLAIFRVAAGHNYIEPEIEQELALLTVRTSGRSRLSHPFKDLTRRDLEILRLLGEGYSMLQIADTIGLSYKTVANNCTQMKKKLGLARTTDLIGVAIEHQVSSQTGGGLKSDGARSCPFEISPRLTLPPFGLVSFA